MPLTHFYSARAHEPPCLPPKEQIWFRTRSSPGPFNRAAGKQRRFLYEVVFDCRGASHGQRDRPFSRSDAFDGARCGAKCTDCDPGGLQLRSWVSPDAVGRLPAERLAPPTTSILGSPPPAPTLWLAQRIPAASMAPPTAGLVLIASAFQMREPGGLSRLTCPAVGQDARRKNTKKARKFL